MKAMARKKQPEDHVGLGWVAREALELLKRNPKGLSIHQLRARMSKDPGAQQHFDRRVREIRAQYDLTIRHEGRDQFYILGSRLTNPKVRSTVTNKLRAAVIHAAHGRCQMCGLTISKDGAVLQVDHKVPIEWGGTNDRANLWAICRDCNLGKRNFFSSLPDEQMSNILQYDSVHERIAQFLRYYINKPVPDYLIETVANIKDQQLDWRKRLRELRYPVIGLDIDMKRRRLSGGATRVDYTLKNWRDLPPDHQKLIREYERSSKGSKQPF